ncbi:hypothetical protein H5410_041441 [Solanum commersonii]|uniref:Gag-pol polyprotein n=1 Tax=Solanum commersonii TaxID=4109 RepID=A0A9J5XTM5_SOLCO|nr:hypothetical protein H5410_041441 [Solanum commersonii]
MRYNVADGERVEQATYKMKGVARESMSVHEYGVKFTQLSCYSPEMVADMRSKMSLFVSGLSRLSSTEGKAAMLIGDMAIARLMIHMQMKKSNANRSTFQNKLNGPTLSSASAPAPRNRGEFRNHNSQSFEGTAAQS